MTTDLSDCGFVDKDATRLAASPVRSDLYPHRAREIDISEWKPGLTFMRPAERFVYQFDTGLPDLVTYPAVHNRAPNDLSQRQHEARRDLLLTPLCTTDELRDHWIHTRLTAHKRTERIRSARPHDDARRIADGLDKRPLQLRENGLTWFGILSNIAASADRIAVLTPGG